MTRDKTRNPVKWQTGREALTTHMSLFHATFCLMLCFKPLFVRAEWKQLGETQERPGRVCRQEKSRIEPALSLQQGKSHTQKGTTSTLKNCREYREKSVQTGHGVYSIYIQVMQEEPQKMR